MTAFRRAAYRLGDCWWGLCDMLLARRRDLAPRQIDQIEGDVKSVLPRVAPPASFRKSLGDNLALAAQQQMAGLAIEYPRPFRQGIILGASAGVLVVALAVLTLVFRSRLSNSRR